MKKLFILILLLPFFNLYNPNLYADVEQPNITSETAGVIDAKTGAILYEKNAEQSMYPASLTKIATAIYAIETGNLNDIVTISENASAINVEGTTVFLEEGEEVSLKKLVQGMLINSGNDAGIAIAEHLSGSVEQFADDLNKYLRTTVGVENTHFENPHGLFSWDHQTTALDLALITKYALQNETFKEIFGTVTLDWKGKVWDTTIISHHKMLKGEIPYEEVVGGKTGYVDQSGHTLATYAEGDNISFIVITMKSGSQQIAYGDTEALLDFGFENFITETFEGGTVIELKNQGFKIPDTVYYTIPKNENIEKEVTPNGMLTITDTSHTIENNIQLEKVQQVEQAFPMISSDQESSSSVLLPVIGVMLLFIVLYSIRIVVRKKKRQKQIYSQYF